MLNVDEMLQQVEAYQRNRLSIKDFDGWFEDSFPEPSRVAEVERLRLSIQAALAQYHFDHIGESAFREELQKSVLPFALGPVYARPIQVVLGKPLVPLGAYSVSPALCLVFGAL